MVVAYGFGPRGFRYALCGVAVIYFVLLIRHPSAKSPLHPISWFTEATGLFPQADRFAVEYRLEAWSCAQLAWKPIDPTPNFPIQADDKESRLQRVAHFYKHERVVMRALDEYVTAAHVDSDGVPGTVGGIRLVQIETTLPPPGGDVQRYSFDPLAPIDDNAPDCKVASVPVCFLFYAPSSLRKKRCGPQTSH